MNLTALRERIKNQMDYSPELQAYNDQIDSLINEAYLNIWTSKRWNFAQKLNLFQFLPDILPTRDITGGATIVNASVTKGSRRVTFSASIARLISRDWEGAIFDLDNLEYVISKVVSTQEILLERPFLGTTNIDSTDWVIKKRYYQLPQDCLELLSLSHRDNPSNVGAAARLANITVDTGSTATFNGTTAATASTVSGTGTFTGAAALNTLTIAAGGTSTFTSTLASSTSATIADTGTATFNGDNIPATSAALCYPFSVAFDISGYLLWNSFFLRGFITLPSLPR
jgi:hypothetical protein